MDFEVFDEGYDMSTGFPIPLAKAVIYAPIANYDWLRALSEQDCQQILGAVNEIWPYREGDSAIMGIIYRLDPESLQEAPDNSDDLLHQLDHLRNIMIAVSTGGPRIDDVNAEYKEALVNLTRELGKRNIQNPIPYRDLWDWYGKWSSGDLPTYQSRREYIRGLVGSLEARLRDGLSSGGIVVFQEPTGWTRVDRTLGEVRSRLESASTEEQFQAVGLLCREVLISLAQTVFDPDQHPALDGVEVSKTDAKRSVCFRGVGSARLHAPLWNQISTSPNWRSSCVNQKERVRTKRAVDYGRACRRRVPELPYPVSKRNLEPELPCLSLAGLTKSGP